MSGCPWSCTSFGTRCRGAEWVRSSLGVGAGLSESQDRSSPLLSCSSSGSSTPLDGDAPVRGVGAGYFVLGADILGSMTPEVLITHPEAVASDGMATSRQRPEVPSIPK